MRLLKFSMDGVKDIINIKPTFKVLIPKVNLCTSSHFRKYVMTADSKNKTLYNSLGISPSASQKEIKAAYYKLSTLYHPDKNHSKSSDVFIDISLAYEVLSNHESKQKYDNELMELGLMSNSSFCISPFTINSTKRTYQKTKQIYDFDEWYRWHYNAAIKNRMQSIHRCDKSSKMYTRRQTQHSGHDKEVIFTITLTMFIIFLLKCELV
uniref:J domain-containing protein n=1 Tax=Clastoptera arizonana TaxID=38151 RepID=A0A1B6DVX8_9HEMI